MEHPGTLLGKTLSIRCVRQSFLAKRIKIAPTQINMVIQGKRPITIKLAVGLEDVLIGTAKEWLYKQADYDLFLYLNTLKK